MRVGGDGSAVDVTPYVVIFPLVDQTGNIIPSFPWPAAWFLNRLIDQGRCVDVVAADVLQIVHCGTETARPGRAIGMGLGEFCHRLPNAGNGHHFVEHASLSGQQIKPAGQRELASLPDNRLLCAVLHEHCIAIKRAANNPIWYNGAAKIVTENIGMIEQTADSMAIKTEAGRETAAGRMRRCRARRRAGFRCYVIELHFSEIDTLVHRGLLRTDERDDEGAVVDALSQYIEQTLGPPL
jgi:hypothetical protein